MTQAVSSEPHGLAALDWTFADRIRKVRRDVLAIDQGEFATRLGVTRQAYAAWESGRNEPRSILAVAKRIEAMSGVPAAWVLGLDITQANTQANTHVRSMNDTRTVIAFPQVRRLPQPPKPPEPGALIPLRQGARDDHAA